MSEWVNAPETHVCSGCQLVLERAGYMKGGSHICETRQVFIDGDPFQPGDFWFEIDVTKYPVVNK